MYWSRTGDLLDLLPLLLLGGLWWLAGWLLATHLFRVRARERIVLGLAIGLLLFIVLSNIFAQVFGFVPGLWVAVGVAVAMGCAAAWRSGQRRPKMVGVGAWLRVLALVLLTLLFTLINRGLGIFDDYFNLPLVSVMAAGDIPPHFFLDPQALLSYHYALHMVAATMVRVGGMFPWSALDMAKALVMALMIVLTYDWVARVTRSQLAGLVAAAAITLAGGTRWLLLFLPGPTLTSISSGVHLMGSALDAGPTLREALLGYWRMDGEGPLPLPFAFASSLFQPSVLSLGGSGVLSILPVLTMLLTQRRQWTLGRIGVSALLLASLGLIAELDYAMLCAGIVVGFLLWAMVRKGGVWKPAVKAWLGLLVCSALVVGLQGGVLTDLLRDLVNRWRMSATVASMGLAAFYWHWPPALVSGAFGPLSLLNPGQALLICIEIGPILLVAPAVIAWTWQRNARGHVLLGALGAGSILGFVLPMLLWYGDFRDSSRSLGESLSWWLVLAIPVVWPVWHRRQVWAKAAVAAGLFLAMFAGVVILGIQTVAIGRPQLTYFIGGQDARLSREYWNRLQPDAQVFDRIPYRSVTLFGRPVLAAEAEYGPPLPLWDSARKDPIPSRLLAAGYSYLYIDDTWWNGLAEGQRLALSQPCVRLVGSAEDGQGHFRRLLSVADCGKASGVVERR